MHFHEELTSEAGIVIWKAESWRSVLKACAMPILSEMQRSIIASIMLKELKFNVENLVVLSGELCYNFVTYIVELTITSYSHSD